MIVVDYTRAAHLLHPFAEKGDARAQFHLGPMYAKGLGVSEDFAEAVKWYRKAADQGNAVGQANLSLMYAKGLGVPQNDQESNKWFKKAFDQQLAEDRSNPATGHPSDPVISSRGLAAAGKWYRKAADQGELRWGSTIWVGYMPRMPRGWATRRTSFVHSCGSTSLPQR